MSEDRLQNDPAVRDEHHEQAQRAAQNDGRNLSVPLCTQMNTVLSIARTLAATTVSVGCQRKAAGAMSPTVRIYSITPRVSRRASRFHSKLSGQDFRRKRLITSDENL